jgi:hypothetical protein
VKWKGCLKSHLDRSEAATPFAHAHLLTAYLQTITLALSTFVRRVRMRVRCCCRRRQHAPVHDAPWPRHRRL